MTRPSARRLAALALVLAMVPSARAEERRWSTPKLGGRSLSSSAAAPAANPSGFRDLFNAGEEAANPAEKIQLYTKALAQWTPEDEVYYKAWAHMKRGANYASLNQFDPAIQDLDTAIELNANFAEAYASRGVTYASLKQYNRATQDLDKAILLSKKSRMNSDTMSNVFLVRATVNIELKRYNRAIQDLDTAIKLKPDYVDAYQNRGILYGVLGQYDRAIQDDDKVILLQPNLAMPHNNRGFHYASLKQYDRAIRDFDKAIELDPRLALAFANRGFAYAGLRQYERAIKDYDKALELNPAVSEAAEHRDAARAALRAGTETAAAGHFKDGERLLAQGDVEQAIDSLNKAVELSPDNQQYRRTTAAALLARAGPLVKTDPKLAHLILDRAAQLDPSDAGIRNLLGAAKYHQGEHAAAMADFDVVLSSRPDAVWNDYRGLCLATTGRLAEAKETIKKALDGRSRAGGDLRAEAKAMLGRIAEYERRLAVAQGFEDKEDLQAAIVEVEAAQKALDLPTVVEKLESLREQSRKQAEQRRENLIWLVAGVIVLVFLVGVGVAAGRRSKAAPPQEKEPESLPFAAAAAGSSTGRLGSAAFRPRTEAELTAASRHEAEMDRVALDYVKAGRSRDFPQTASGLAEPARAAFAMAFLRAGAYDAAHELLKDCRPTGKEAAAYKVLHRVISLRRAGALSTEFVAYGERLGIANQLDSLKLGREAAGVLGAVVDTAWKAETDSYLVAQVFDDAGQADDFAAQAGTGRPPGFYSGYAQAFLQRGRAGAGLVLLKKKPALEGEDWGLLVSLHAKDGSLEELAADELPEDKRVLLAEALIEDGKEAPAMDALEKVSRSRWSAREYGCALRALQRQDRFEQARALFQDAQSRIAVEAAPELRYYWAVFCERHGDFGRAKATYQELLKKTRGYKDADVRLQRIDAISPDELTHLTTVMAMRDTRAAASAAGAVVPETEPPAAAMVASRYEILRPLGVGGMGLVYKARDRQTGREVALKRLRQSIARDPEHRRLLLDEAATLAELKHAGIVGFHETVEHEGSTYLVFEYVDGETVADLLACRGAFQPRQCVRLLSLACEALGHAHEKGVAHLDVKPANIMMDRKGAVKMMDFGIARHVDAVGLEQTQATGTPAYMAPEQHAGRPGYACDVYSLGVTAYELLTGDLPFLTGKGLREVKERESYAALPDAVPEKLKDLVVRCLKADPSARPPGMKALLAELAAVFGQPAQPEAA
ncbi:MAG: tetratricopeptide repeat protein [Elusimicrobia bacterium]|nr:tetratricopeptide repeat protein [Elusimicrobiota bacterium]